MNLRQRLLSRQPRDEQRFGVNQWLDYFKYNGSSYPFAPSYSMTQDKQEIDASFASLVQQAYLSNGVVFACVSVRQLLFSEMRFQYQRVRNGQPGDLFGGSALSILENPWPNGTQRDLLTRALQDVDLGGNFYAVREGNRIMRLRPDWVEIGYGSKTSDDPNAPDIEVIGYIYYPGGKGNHKSDPVVYMREQVAHWAPHPHPLARGIGVSWIGPVIEEIAADKSATTHKRKFFENAATPNMAITFPVEAQKETAERFMQAFKERNEGVVNAYKTLFMGAGADIKVVGADMRQLDFKVTQGAGETRIAAAANVPPILVGLSEGLEASTYSNYASARRRFADGTIRPLWGSFCKSMSPLVSVPSDAQLWYDDRHVSFLQEDQKDAAEIQQTLANTRRTLIESGYEPKSVNDAVLSGDYSRLVHTELVSVQLQPPGTDPAAIAASPEPKQIPAKTGQASATLAEALSRTPL